MDIAEANQAQAEYWNSEEGSHWLEYEERYERILAPFVAHLLRGAELRGDDRALDIGCGIGPTTRAAARVAAAGEVLGVDISRPMIERAVVRAKEEGLTNVRFDVGDAQVYPFAGSSFDVAMSRFGIMFFADPTAAFANIAGALRPEGRLALLCWQPLPNNEWVFVPGAAVASVTTLPPGPEPGAPGPFSLAEPDRVRAVLTGAGFVGVELEPVHEPMRLGDTVADAITYFSNTGFGKAVFREADDDTRARIIDALETALAPHVTTEGMQLGGAAWLVTARRG